MSGAEAISPAECRTASTETVRAERDRAALLPTRPIRPSPDCGR